VIALSHPLLPHRFEQPREFSFAELKSRTKAELQQLCREHELHGFSTLNKKELLEFIKSHHVESEQEFLPPAVGERGGRSPITTAYIDRLLGHLPEGPEKKQFEANMKKFQSKACLGDRTAKYRILVLASLAETMSGKLHNYCEALGKPTEEKYLLDYFRHERGQRAIEHFRTNPAQTPSQLKFNEAAARIIYKIRV
jgi:hypothetical protein